MSGGLLFEEGMFMVLIIVQFIRYSRVCQISHNQMEGLKNWGEFQSWKVAIQGRIVCEGPGSIIGQMSPTGKAFLDNFSLGMFMQHICGKAIDFLRTSFFIVWRGQFFARKSIFFFLFWLHRSANMCLLNWRV